MGILDNLEAYLELDEMNNSKRGGPKCYYCNNKAIHIKSYTDDIDGISYEYEHCQEHADIDDHTQEALDLWKLHQESDQNLEDKVIEEA